MNAARTAILLFLLALPALAIAQGGSSSASNAPAPPAVEA